MRISVPCVVVSACLLVLSLGCGKKEQAEKSQVSTKVDQIADKISQLTEKGGKSVNRGVDKTVEIVKKSTETVKTTVDDVTNIPAVDFRKLKDLLPKKAGGLKRTELDGSVTGGLGISMSSAEATYSDENGITVKVKVSDFAGSASIASSIGWTSADYDKQTEHGYDKTTTFDGWKAREEYIRKDDLSRLDVMVKNRFFIQASGRQVDMDTLRGVMQDIPLKKIGKLGD